MDDYKNNNKNDKNFCDGIGEISEGDDCKVDEELIKVKIDEFGNILKDHGDKINDHGERINEVEWGLKHLIKNQENFSGELKVVNTNLMSYHNNVLGSLNNLLMNKQNNETKIETTRIEGKSKLYIQICILIGSIIATGGTMYIAMK